MALAARNVHALQSFQAPGQTKVAAMQEVKVNPAHSAEAACSV